MSASQPLHLPCSAAGLLVPLQPLLHSPQFLVDLGAHEVVDGDAIHMYNQARGSSAQPGQVESSHCAAVRPGDDGREQWRTQLACWRSACSALLQGRGLQLSVESGPVRQVPAASVAGCLCNDAAGADGASGGAQLEAGLLFSHRIRQVRREEFTAQRQDV